MYTFISFSLEFDGTIFGIAFESMMFKFNLKNINNE